MDKEQARAIHGQLLEIADYNIDNETEYADSYAQAKASVEGVYAQIEKAIFDCDYFYEKLIPEYKANPNDRATYLRVYQTLVKRGCSKSDPMLREMAVKDSLFVMADLKANNPGYAANELYKAGSYNEAIAKYEEAINIVDDAEKKSSYYFTIASINFRKLKKTGEARTYARKAIAENPNNGKAYELIGDMYATGARNCGNKAWDNSLAVLAALEKYRKAKAVDPSLAPSVNKKLNTYAGSKPNKEDGFMMGVKEGQTVKVPCWIGETVTVRY